VQIAQTIHAAGESFKDPLRIRGSPIYAVALAAKNEDQLLKLEEKLLQSGIPHKAIREPDRDNELMAIGIVPGSREKLRKFTRKFSLVV